MGPLNDAISLWVAGCSLVVDNVEHLADSPPICSGTLKWIFQLVKKGSRTVFCLGAAMGTASNHRKPRSMMEQVSESLGGQQWATRSMWMCWNLLVGVGKLEGCSLMWWCTFARWQGRHSLAQLATLLAMCGQLKKADSSRFEAFMPG